MSVLAALISVWLSVPAVTVSDDASRCDSMYAAIEERMPPHNITEHNTLQDVLSRIRSTRACYGEGVLSPQTVRLYAWEAYALSVLQEHRKALRVIDAFFDRFGEEPDSSAFQVMYHTRGVLHYFQGHMAQAIAAFTQAYHFATGASLVAQIERTLDLKSVYQRIRDFRTAAYFSDVAGERLQQLAPDHEQWHALMTRYVLGRADLLLEEPSLTGNVARSLQEAVALANEYLSFPGTAHDTPERVTWAYMLLGDAYGMLGRAERAMPYYVRAQETARQAADRSWPYFIQYKIGRQYFRMGRFDAAYEAFERALAQIHNAAHPDNQRRLLTDVGRLFEAQGRYAEAEGYYRRAIRRVNRYRETLRTTQWSALAFARWQQPYRGLVRVLLAQDRIEEAFQALEQTKGRHLDDLRRRRHLLDTLSTEVRHRWDSLTTELAAVRDQLTSVSAASGRYEALLNREARLATQRRALFDVQSDTVGPSLDAIRRALQAGDRVVVSYFLDTPHFFQDGGVSPQHPVRSYAFVVTKAALRAVPLEVSRDSVQALMGRVSPLFGAENFPSVNDRQFSLEALHRLYDALVAPLASYLPEQAPLAVVPDGPLYSIPFAMLVEEPAAGFRYQEAPFLLHRHPISVELAARMLVEERPPPASPPLDVLAFGRTTFDDLSLPRTVHAAAFEALPPLPAVEDELASIRRHFASVEVAKNDAATEGRFRRQMDQAAILHLATHAVYGPNYPLQNAVLLAPDTSDRSGEDGILYLHELQGRTLPAEMVVLSGCNTARGTFYSGEGMAGLQYAFRVLGVPSSVATLWLVDDRATAQLVEAFYRHLSAGYPRDEALRHAQQEYLRTADVRKRSPFYWAAPVLYGDTRPLPLTRGADERWEWLWQAGGILALLVLLQGTRVFLRYRRRS